MHPLIYDVAVSLDGYISGPDGDISKFAHDGPVVKDYAARLAGYATAIMGRKTYEFGYAFGLTPGQNPYPQMNTFVFSQSLTRPQSSAVSVIPNDWAATIRRLKSASKGPIYLCGGGTFAGWLLDEGLIDQLVLKRAPVSYGSGVALFSGSKAAQTFARRDIKSYSNGYMLEHLVL